MLMCGSWLSSISASYLLIVFLTSCNDITTDLSVIVDIKVCLARRDGLESELESQRGRQRQLQEDIDRIEDDFSSGQQQLQLPGQGQGRSSGSSSAVKRGRSGGKEGTEKLSKKSRT
jgi:hypothetical protein